MPRLRLVVAAALAATLGVPAGVAARPTAGGRASSEAAGSEATAALEAMRHAAGGRIQTHVAPETGSFDFVRVIGDRVLAADGASAAPEARARAFLRSHGAVLGMTAAERGALDRTLRHRETFRDPAGNHHVRFEQIHDGRRVFAGHVVVHMNRRGITGVNGTFVPRIDVPSSPSITEAGARGIALNTVGKAHHTTEVAAETARLTVYRPGIAEGIPGANYLAWDVTVTGPAIRDRVWVDATRGSLLGRMSAIHAARDRVAYSPQYDPNNPERFALRSEGEPETHVPPVDKLYDFTGQVYDLFANTFGRDSYDGKGITMRTVYLINEICPNAYWNSSTTNYCPGFDLDDVVAHEWGHAFTEHTHELIYHCQPGALNESYSDIWGEILDLLNDSDGIGGSVNDKTYPDGQRWLVGEDLGKPVHEALLRDMWNPNRVGDPGKVSDAPYVCGAADGGGVHTNSGVPNHAFVMLVDGKTYNGRTVRGIGMTKAAHIYYQAMAAYQTEGTKFPTHEMALRSACRDLLGVNLKALMTGALSGERITADDCAQVANAAAAAELSKTPEQCTWKPLLDPAPQPPCPGAGVAFHQTFENGATGWTFGTQGVTQDFPGTKWLVRGSLPGGRAGRALFAEDPAGGVYVESRGNWSGRYWADSPEIAIPTGVGNLTLRFDHYVATDSSDGGNVWISVDGGEFALLSTYVFNGPVGNIPDATPYPVGAGNTNPKAGQAGWFGSDGGEVTGTWATTIASLTAVAPPGSKVRLRFDFGIDQAGGFDGWYVDDIAIYSCPEIAPPVLSLGEYAEPDPDRALRLSWTRPGGGSGPDEVQRTAGARTLLTEDAESGLGAWTTTTSGTGMLGWQTTTFKSHGGVTSFVARALKGTINAEAVLQRNDPISIPARGDTRLVWHDWYTSESDDAAIVEVDAGGGWKPVDRKQVSLYAHEAALGYLQAPLLRREADLGAYAGKSVRLRFRYAMGPSVPALSTPLFGWHVDDITIETIHWETASRPAAAFARVTNLADGAHEFRVRTTYRSALGVSPGPWSNTVKATVKGKAPTVKGNVVKPRPLPATGVGAPDVAMLLLTGAAMLARIRRRET